MLRRAIKVFRKYHEMSVLDVSNATGISIDTIKKIESGEKVITADYIEKIAKAYDIPAQSLVFFSDRFKKHEQKIPKKFRVFACDKVLNVLEWLNNRAEQGSKSS